MFPRNSVHHRPNCSLRDVEHTRQFTLRSQRIILSNKVHVVVGERRLRVFHAVRSACPVKASLGNHVVDVFKLPAEPQVRGIDAPRTVSIRTIVKHFAALWYRSKVKNPTGPVREDNKASASDPSVAIRHSAASPKPARLGDLNLLEKSRREGGRKSLRQAGMLNKFAHRLVSLPVVDFRSQRAF